MSLAHILYPPPTKGGFQEWALQHFAHHQAIINGVKQKMDIVLPMRLIYPIVDPKNKAQINVFLEEHATMHADMAGPLSIQTNDLSDVDFENPKQTASWMNLHYFEHLAAATNLGLPI